MIRELVRTRTTFDRPARGGPCSQVGGGFNSVPVSRPADEGKLPATVLLRHHSKQTGSGEIRKDPPVFEGADVVAGALRYRSAGTVLTTHPGGFCDFSAAIDAGR